MVQWMNLHWNDSFADQTRLLLLCEKSGIMLLVLVGLMAGQQSVEIWVDSKSSTDCTVRISTESNEGTVLL